MLDNALCLALNRLGQGGIFEATERVGHRLVKKPAGAYRFLTLISSMAFLTGAGREIDGHEIVI